MEGRAVRPRSYRVDCTNCQWYGYRFNAFDCECYDDYVYYCTPTSPGPGCPNGANLRAPCPRCRNFRLEIYKNAPLVWHDKGEIRVRAVWTVAERRAFHKARGRKAATP